MNHKIFMAMGSTLLFTACTGQSPEILPPSQALATKPMSSESVPVHSASSLRYPLLSKQCGGVELVIQCDPRDIGQGAKWDCKETSLYMRKPTGQVLSIARPKELSNYTAVGLGCTTTPNKNISYFVVQYGELPSGCKFCEWNYLYDINGEQLTHSDPPVLTDPSLPKGKDQYPNTNEFDTISREQRLVPADLSYVECDSSISELDKAGNPICLKEFEHAEQ